MQLTIVDDAPALVKGRGTAQTRQETAAILEALYTAAPQQWVHLTCRDLAEARSVYRRMWGHAKRKGFQLETRFRTRSNEIWLRIRPEEDAQ